MQPMEDVFEEPNKESDENPDEKDKPRVPIKNATDLQRLKLEKLMKNPDKPVLIPERPQERKPPTIPDFVRNVMGSSAGAGSGEFHVYRHLRRKEYARQKYIQMKSLREEQDAAFHAKIEENERIAREATAKRRAKRLKRKEKKKKIQTEPGKQKDNMNNESEENDEDDSETNEETNIRDPSESGNEEKDNEEVSNQGPDKVLNNEEVKTPGTSK